MKLAKHIRLRFEAKDIRFIIVRKDNEIPEMLGHLEDILGKKTPQYDFKILSTRLISLEQVMEDL